MTLLSHLCAEIFGATWRASLLIALIFALRPLLVRSLPLKVLPWLWLVAAIKLLLISAPTGWWSLYNLSALVHFFQTAPAPTQVGPLPVAGGIIVPGTPVSLPSAEETWSWTAVLSVVWLIGVAVLFAIQAGAYLRFHRQLAREAKSTAQEWQDLLEECATRVGVKVPLLIEIHSLALGSPAVIGLLRPRLVVPHGLLDCLEPEEARLVFIHELSHLRRRDLWLLTFFGVARTLHWFNPLAWLAERALRIDCEAACDAEVLRLTSSPSEHYGRTLLRLTQLNRPGEVSILVAAISTNSNQTQRRIELIMKYQNPARWMSVTALVLAVGMGALVLPNEVVAQENTNVAAPPSAAKPGVAVLEQKLKSIVIDKVNFDKADITDVVQFLQTKSKELDPDKEGVNFVLRLDLKPADQARVQIHRKISLTLENVSLGQVLEYIAQQTNLQYSVQDYAVYIRPAIDDAEVLSVRTYLVPPNFPMTIAGKPWPKDASQVDVKESMQAHGILFPVGSTATYLPESNKLVVRNTPQQLDLIVNLFDALSALPPGPIKQNVIKKFLGITFSADFNAATLPQALNYLTSETKRLAPDHQGVGFVIDPTALAAAKPITLTLNNVSLGQMLESTTEQAGVAFKLGDDIVQIVPAIESSPTTTQPDTAAGQATLKKLQSMVVDKVNFQQLDVEKVLQLLAAKSKELDPDKKGINFVLGSIAPTDHVHRPVTVVLDNVPISELLDYVTQQTNLHYSVGDNTVLFKP